MNQSPEAEFHEHADQLLDDYVLGTLPANDRAWMDEHVRACLLCPETIVSLRRAVLALPFAAPDPYLRISDGVWTRIAQALSTTTDEVETERESGPVPLVFDVALPEIARLEPSPSLTRRQWVMVAGLMMISLLGGVLLAQVFL